jgi:hypothetical protein
MARLLFCVEGQTEQEYVKRVLEPHLAGFGVYLQPTSLAPFGNPRKDGTLPKGGVTAYKPIRKFLGLLLGQDRSPDFHVTTMFDLYGLKPHWPGWDDAEMLRHLPRSRVEALETAFAADVADPRFVPHLQLHEFETILLCAPDLLALSFDSPDAGIATLQEAVAQCAGESERVNDGPHSAPSKRVAAVFPGYPNLKTTTGVRLAECTGLAAVRAKCPHFDAWISRLEQLGASHAARSGPG